MTEIRAAYRASTTEAQWTSTVIDTAQAAGFLVAHFRPALSQSGRWHTAVQGDGVGYPDLTLVHPATGRLLFAELKSTRGRLTEQQWRWLRALETVPCVETAVWRPQDEVQMRAVLGVRLGA